MPFNLGFGEVLIILIIVLLLFGAKRIPELAKGLGSGVREFRKGTREDYEVDEEKDEKSEELVAGEAEKPRPEDATAEADRAEQKPS